MNTYRKNNPIPYMIVQELKLRKPHLEIWQSQKSLRLVRFRRDGMRQINKENSYLWGEDQKYFDADTARDACVLDAHRLSLQGLGEVRLGQGTRARYQDRYALWQALWEQSIEERNKEKNET